MKIMNVKTSFERPAARWTAPPPSSLPIALVLALLALAGLTPLHAALYSDNAATASPAANVQGSTQPAAAPAPAGAPGNASDHKAMMEAYEALAKPGEHHKRLDGLVGKWNVTGKTWMVPGQPAVEMHSTTEASWVLGGHYVQERHQGSFFGMPFEGMAIDGYDNVKHEYFSNWYDNMGTGVEHFTGSCDDPCRTLTLVAEGIDPMTGKSSRTRETTTFVDQDTYHFEMYMVGAGPDGKDVKVMELDAKRAK